MCRRSTTTTTDNMNTATATMNTSTIRRRPFAIVTALILFITISWSGLVNSYMKIHSSYEDDAAMIFHSPLLLRGLRNNIDEQKTNSNHDDVLRRTQDIRNSTGTICDTAEDTGGWVNSIPKPLQYTLITVLILFSAFFSGLTLSMMGLDVTGLEIVMSGDDLVLSR